MAAYTNQGDDAIAWLRSQASQGKLSTSDDDGNFYRKLISDGKQNVAGARDLLRDLEQMQQTASSKPRIMGLF